MVKVLRQDPFVTVFTRFWRDGPTSDVTLVTTTFLPTRVLFICFPSGKNNTFSFSNPYSPPFFLTNKVKETFFCFRSGIKCFGSYSVGTVEGRECRRVSGSYVIHESVVNTYLLAWGRVRGGRDSTIRGPRERTCKDSHTPSSPISLCQVWSS